LCFSVLAFSQAVASTLVQAFTLRNDCLQAAAPASAWLAQLGSTTCSECEDFNLIPWKWPSQAVLSRGRVSRIAYIGPGLQESTDWDSRGVVLSDGASPHRLVPAITDLVTCSLSIDIPYYGFSLHGSPTTTAAMPARTGWQPSSLQPKPVHGYHAWCGCHVGPAQLSIRPGAGSDSHSWF
jgi:hypothetical protein